MYNDNYPRDEHGVILVEHFMNVDGKKMKLPVHANGYVWLPDGTLLCNFKEEKKLTFASFIRQFTMDNEGFRIEDYENEGLEFLNEPEIKPEQSLDDVEPLVPEPPLPTKENVEQHHQQLQKPVPAPTPVPVKAPQPQSRPQPAVQQQPQPAPPQRPTNPQPQPIEEVPVQHDTQKPISRTPLPPVFTKQSAQDMYGLGDYEDISDTDGMAEYAYEEDEAPIPVQQPRPVPALARPVPAPKAAPTPKKPISPPKEKRNKTVKPNISVSDDDMHQTHSSNDVEPRPANPKLMVGICVVLIILGLITCMQGYLIYVGIQSGNSSSDSLPVLPTVEYDPNGTSLAENERVIIKINKELKAGDTITETDITGIVVSLNKYNALSAVTYVAEDGSTKNQTIIPWDDRASVINKFAAQDLPSGSYVTNLNVTAQKVVKDKYFVEVEYEGKTKVVQVNGDGTGNTGTRVELIAVITQDGSEPYQTTLGELYLKDRELENLFDRAGMDILDSLTKVPQSEVATPAS